MAPVIDLPLRAGLAAVNRLLRRQAWAQAKLRLHAGSVLSVQLPALALPLHIEPDGALALSRASSAADAVIHLPPLAVLRVLARQPGALREVPVQGDVHLAADLAYVFQHLDWQVEEELSRLLGDIAAHHVMQVGASLHTWHRATLQRWSQVFSEYLTEERRLLARPGQVRGYVDAVDALRDDADRLEKKLELLQNRL